MKVVHPNYCRKASQQFMEILDRPNTPHDLRGPYQMALRWCSHAVKFALPLGGRLIWDEDLKGLEGLEKLSLPFPSIALEYETDPSAPGFAPTREDQTHVPKRIVLAADVEDRIEVMYIGYVPANGIWVPSSVTTYGYLDKVEYLDRHVLNAKGHPRLILRGSSVMGPLIPDHNTLANDIGEEMWCVLMFLNALSCTNVKVERSDPEFQPKKKKGREEPLPFDSYHFLTIDVGRKPSEPGAPLLVDRRSPREHIRRGHIRRYETGQKIWINSTVVNAGVGGKITKDYGIYNSRLAA